MPVLDDRGRLFGKVNLIDAAVAVFVLLLVPLAYGAWALFRAPTPRIKATTPQTVESPKGKYVEVRGENLRPFLRVFAGTTAAEFLFESPDKAQVRLPELAPGVYDLTMYDEAQLVATQPRAITVIAPPQPVAAPAGQPPPLVSVVLLGTFHRLDPIQTRMLRPGLKFVWLKGDGSGTPAHRIDEELSEKAEIVAVLPPAPDTVALADNVVVGAALPGKEQVTAIVRLHATLVGRELRVENTKLSPSVELPIPLPGASKNAPRPTLSFVVARLFPEATKQIQLQMRFPTRPDIVQVVQREMASAVRLPEPFRALTPQVLSFKVTSEFTGQTLFEQREGRVSIAEGTVRVPAVRTAEGWSYQNRILRAGSEFNVETPGYVITGLILSISAPGAADDRVEP